MSSLVFDESTYSTDDRNKGQIATSKSGVLCINIFKHGNHYWEPIENLSASNWKKYRNNVSENITKMLEKEEAKRNNIIKSTNANIENIKGLFYKIYKNLSIDDKKLFIKENKNSWLAKESCPICLNRTAIRNKCIHNDCCGVCESCCDNMFDDNGFCKACSKSQLIECPICYDENPIDKMCKSANCSHYVCWSCYGRAHHSGNTIHNCPTCRANFVNYSDYDSSDDEILSDSEIWEDEDGNIIDVIRELEDRISAENPNASQREIISVINTIINHDTEINQEQVVLNV
jgi:hypothetical protein